MSKASTRRRQARLRRLPELSYKDPDEFYSRWRKLLSSWQGLVLKIASDTINGEGKHLRHTISGLMQEAEEILSRCNPKAVRRVQNITCEFQTFCCQQIARALDSYLYPPASRFEPKE